ncbi:MAG: hypothetical protein OXC46_02500 [Thaumarchaeota archaeon]|nr:hypothetical protein [Nitrososphaerota archaeon]
MRNETLLEIKFSLLEMKKTKKINFGILTNLSNLGDLLKNIKSKWLKIKNYDWFYFYQYVVTLEFTLEQMEYRFKNSQSQMISKLSMIP